MFYYAKICFICLEPKEMLKEICPSNEESDTYKHITFVLPELVLSDVGKTARVCTSCQFTLESYHTFKKMCLENYCQWTNYVAQAKTDQEKEFSRKRKHCETQSETIHETIIHEPIIEPIPIENVFIKTEPDLIIDEMEVEDTETESEVKNEVSEVPSSEDSSSNKRRDAKERTPYTEEINWNKLSIKSRLHYEKVYNRFMDWRRKNNIHTFTQPVMKTYFNYLLTGKLKSTTVLSFYSILRTTIIMKHNVDIGKYKGIYQQIKRQSIGEKPDTSEIFTPEQMHDFLNRAPDEQFLLAKVALIIGVIGALGRDDLKRLTLNDVQDFNNSLQVTVRDIKFSITGKFYHICKKYLNIRPKGLEQCFFLNYQKGRSTKQVIGIHSISQFPQQVALFLQLPNPRAYTGKCFRYTAATVVVDSKGNFIKQQRRWKKVLHCPNNTKNVDSEDELVPIEFCPVKIEPLD